MKSCILTIIKNESYIEDFIKYHLNLGINHIFIFTDVDNNYSYNKFDNVTIKSITEVNPYKIKCQGDYICSGINYIKNNYDYDWCFTLDPDEYITIENNNTLEEILNQFKNYDALVLQWQNYGANGLIYTPDYSNKSIQEIYTKKGPMSCNDKQSMTTKTAYKLKTFTDQSLFSVHLPSDNIKWCKPNFKNIKKDVVYGNIYIRHYITKSFEEYVYKVYIRGMFSKKHRNLEDFFSVNPDMIDKKEELLQLAKQIIENNK